MPSQCRIIRYFHVLLLPVADVALARVLQRTRSPLDALWTYRSALNIDTQVLSPHKLPIPGKTPAPHAPLGPSRARGHTPIPARSQSEAYPATSGGL